MYVFKINLKNVTDKGDSLKAKSTPSIKSPQFHVLAHSHVHSSVKKLVLKQILSY